MDLLTLPSEMLSNVLKYSKFGKLTKLRKRNQIIDILAKRDKLNERIHIDNLEIEFEKREIKLELDVENAEDLGIIRIITPQMNETTLSRLLPRIVILGKMSFLECASDYSCEKQILTSLLEQKQALRLVRSLCIISSNMSFPQTLIYDIFPKIDSLTLKDSEDVYICSKQILGGRQWKSISLDSDATLDDSYLREVFVNCKYVHLRNKNRFTFKGIFQLIETCLETDEEFNRQIDLGRIVDRSILFSSMKFERTLILMEGIKLEKENHRRNGNVIYKITFEDGVDGSYLKFSVPRKALR